MIERLQWPSDQDDQHTTLINTVKSLCDHKHQEGNKPMTLATDKLFSVFWSQILILHQCINQQTSVLMSEDSGVWQRRNPMGVWADSLRQPPPGTAVCTAISLIWMLELGSILSLAFCHLRLHLILLNQRESQTTPRLTSHEFEMSTITISWFGWSQRAGKRLGNADLAANFQKKNKLFSL